MNELQLLPSKQDLETLKEIATMAIKSGFLPKSITTPEQAIIIALKGKEMGIPPLHAFSSIAVINGKPTMSAELMLSLIFKNCKAAVINYTQSDSKACIVEASRGGKVSIFSFTMDDAKNANLLGKTTWQQYPAAMLRARCISAMARAMFPDALMGVIYTPEEIGAEVNEEGEVIEVKALEVSKEPQKVIAPIVKAKIEKPAVEDDVPMFASPQMLMPTKDDLSQLASLAKECKVLNSDVTKIIKERFSKNKAAELSMSEFYTLRTVIQELKHA